MKVLWTRTAFSRLNEISRILEETSLAEAVMWREKALAAAGNLTYFPHAGTSVSEVDGDETFLQIRLGNYRMIYRIDGLIIHIMTFHLHRISAGSVRDGGDEFPNS